jgi:ABC-type nitrate/sulfonate/bicarbonate transport system ATPase subunit
LEKAIYLSDRILIMSARAIAHDLAVDICRPRNRTGKAYQDYLSMLAGMLKNLKNP